MKRTLTLLTAVSLGIIMVCSAAMADGTPETTKPHKHHATKHHKAVKHHAKKAAAKTGKMTKTTTKAVKTTTVKTAAKSGTMTKKAAK